MENEKVEEPKQSKDKSPEKDNKAKIEIDKQRKLANLQKGINKENKEKFEKAQKLISTRDRLERDYKEDILRVTFQTSSETYRTIESRKPTNKEMSIIMILAAKALKAEQSKDPEDILGLSEIYSNMAGLAAKLAVDKTLDEEFWNSCIGSDMLSNFVNGLVMATQRRSGISPEDMSKFR